MSSCYEPFYNNVTIYQSWASTICFAPMSIAEIFSFFKKFLVFSRQSAKRRNAGPQSHRDVHIRTNVQSANDYASHQHAK